MSDPARLFQSLHLDDMPVTRSQSRSPHLAQQQQQQQRRRTLTPRGRGRGRGRGQPPIPLARPTRAHSGIQYDTQVLSPTSSQHAVEGLQSVFVVNRVEKHEPGPDNYYVFQLSKPVEVSIHDPAGNAGKIYECTCDVFRNTQAPCPHIYWLFAGLHAVLNQELEAAAPTPSEIDLATRFGEMYPFIAQRHEILKQALQRISGDVQDNMDANLEVEKDTLYDILAGCSDDLIPREKNNRYVENLSRIPPNEVLIDHNFPATIRLLAMRDNNFFERLQQILPVDVRVKQHYERLYFRAHEAMQRLTWYAERDARRMSDLTVPQCARLLRSLVHQMCEDWAAPTEAIPLDVSIASWLAEMFVHLVARVVTFNRDIYAGAQWNRRQPATEHPRDRNLFAYLIGDPPYNPQDPDWMADHFVIDQLRRFDFEWKHLFERLTTIRDDIEEMDTNGLPMASEYVGQIDEMLRAYTATADEPSSSSSQMPRPG